MKYVLLFLALCLSINCFATINIFEDCSNLRKVEVDVYADNRNNLFLKSNEHLYSVSATDHYQFCRCFCRPHHYDSIAEELSDN